MRTTVIPAQITTVEDKIAGNLNMTQILILMVPIFLTTIIFAFIPPVMKMVWFKVPLVVITFITCGVLSLRIKGRVIMNWLIVLLHFNHRPSFYIFNKNDNYLREVEPPVAKKKQSLGLVKSIKAVDKKYKKFSDAESVKFSHAFMDQNTSLSFKLNNQGGFHVAFEQIKK